MTKRLWSDAPDSPPPKAVASAGRPSELRVTYNPGPRSLAGARAAAATVLVTEARRLLQVAHKCTSKAGQGLGAAGEAEFD